jgi:hypothetical protein
MEKKILKDFFHTQVTKQKLLLMMNAFCATFIHFFRKISTVFVKIFLTTKILQK